MGRERIMSAIPIEDELDERQIEQALTEAHIPSLMAALVHLTGDAGHITEENRPAYDFFGDGQSNIKPEVQAQIRAAAKRAYIEYACGKKLPPHPSHDTLGRM